jgi:hypothetical protein
VVLLGRYDSEGKGPQIQLYETTEEDVITAHDFFVTVLKLSSKGVRVVWYLLRRFQYLVWNGIGNTGVYLDDLDLDSARV